MNLKIFESSDSLYEAINSTGYICDKNIALTIYLAYQLQKPILISGPPGVGKTEIAKVVSILLNSRDCIRLQCYEGITYNEAIYDWDYKKQLLYIEANKTKLDWDSIEDDLYSDKFLSTRPLLKALTSKEKEVLLIDELDKSDEEFEAFLLEFLAENQISIAEFKTIKGNQTPLCFITSNDQRELSNALLRRCLSLYIDYPSIQTETKIVYSRVKDINELLASKITHFVNCLRDENLKKAPSISETIDWANVLVKLNAKDLNTNLVKNTLNVLLKYKTDIELINTKVNSILKRFNNEDLVIKNNEDNVIYKESDINIEDEDWNF